MPSPFPGMDPYLEGPLCFADFHQTFLTYARADLMRVLPEHYYAALEDRTWIETARSVAPDVNVIREEVPTPRTHEPGGGTVVATEIETEPVTITVPLSEERESYIDIYTRKGEGERLVTTVELLSPSNKAPGEKGRDLYKQKQGEILDGQVHLVEIDLLRGGTHTTAVPLAFLRKKVPAFDYHVCIKHFDVLEDYYVHPIHLPSRLPVIAVPLLPGDGAVKLDLQKVLDRAYDDGPYRRRVKYVEPFPAPPLTPEHAAWAEKLLQEKGLRPRP